MGWAMDEIREPVLGNLQLLMRKRRSPGLCPGISPEAASLLVVRCASRGATAQAPLSLD